jgi:hypothetical protein
MIASLLVIVLAGAAAPPTLAEVLERAAAYVAEFEQRLSGIVAEEQYVQEVRSPRRYPAALDHTRRLLSDLLLVRPVGGSDWMQFRDVFDVDGTPVRDRQERLMQIFLDPSATTESQAASILADSARYNIGDVERTVNTPMLALRFLERENQPRFSFRRTRNGSPHAMTGEAPSPPGHFRVATEVWAIEFAEKGRPTLIRTRNRPGTQNPLKDLPAEGRFWIEPATGRVLMSELALAATGARAAITVNYQSEPLLGLLVPVEMRERYDRLRNRTTVEGFATYGRFRQFQVTVDEKLGPIKK